MVLALNLLLAAVVPALAPVGLTIPDDQDARGIYLDGSAPGVKFDVLLVRGAERQTVPSSYEFRSGDQMLFQFSLNREAYVYVLTRTIPGESDRTARYAGSKGIEILQREDSKGERPVAAYRLLFPLTKTGLQNRLTVGGVHTIPANGARFTMDQEPGIEKLYVVISPESIDMSPYFDMETGRVWQDGTPDGRSGHGHLSGLGARLLEWSRNAQTSIAGPASKGITVEGYGVSSNSLRPALIEIDLRHRSQ